MFDHPDHLSLLAQERRALVAEGAAQLAALRAQAPRRQRRLLQVRLASPGRTVGRWPRLARLRRRHVAFIERPVR